MSTIAYGLSHLLCGRSSKKRYTLTSEDVSLFLTRGLWERQSCEATPFSLSYGRLAAAKRMLKKLGRLGVPSPVGNKSYCRRGVLYHALTSLFLIVNLPGAVLIQQCFVSSHCTVASGICNLASAC